MTPAFRPTAGLFAAACLAAAASAQTERPEIVLYDGAGFSGAPQPVTGSEPRLGALRFDDRASSVNVRSGAWELCSEPNFRGDCRVISDRASDLGMLGLNNDVSSVRPVSAESAMDEAETPPIILFRSRGFRGESMAFSATTASLNGTGFEDRARSVQIHSGVWRVCSGRAFTDRCAYLDAAVTDLREFGLSGNISSIELTDYEKGPGGYGIALFADRDQKGPYLGLDGPLADLHDRDFANEASSIQVNFGRWLLCDSTGFRGKCEVAASSLDDLGDLALDDLVSSVRPHVDIADAPVETIYDAAGGHLGEGSVFFARPQAGGTRIDECLRRGGGCGEAAAEAFCRASGLRGAVYNSVVAVPGETVNADGRSVCDDDCRALSDVVCLQ